MRNLKKFLALVLAMMMTLSLMVTVNASSFSDDTDITKSYQEAVDVLTELGVINGYSDGTFLPKESITRAEVAAIIYRITTGDVSGKNAYRYENADYFTDVLDGKWYNGYVNYCANNGLVLGVGNNRFEPSSPVTGYQALVMILRAMGYNNPQEFSTSDWKFKASGYGTRLGITKNIATGSLSGEATREMVAEIMFQAIQKPTVKYSILNDYTENVLVKAYQDGDGKWVYDKDVYETLLYRTFQIVGKRTILGSDGTYGRPVVEWVKDAKDDTVENGGLYIVNPQKAADTAASATSDVYGPVSNDGTDNIVDAGAVYVPKTTPGATYASHDGTDTYEVNADKTDKTAYSYTMRPVYTFNTKMSECDLSKAFADDKSILWANITEYVNGGLVVTRTDASNGNKFDALHTTSTAGTAKKSDYTIGAQGRQTEIYNIGGGKWIFVYIDTILGQVVKTVPHTEDTNGHLVKDSELWIAVNDGLDGSEEAKSVIYKGGKKDFTQSVGELVLLTTYGLQNEYKTGNELTGAAGSDVTEVVNEAILGAVPTVAAGFQDGSGAWVVDLASDTVGENTVVPQETITVTGTIGLTEDKNGVLANGKRYPTTWLYHVDQFNGTDNSDPHTFDTNTSMNGDTVLNKLLTVVKNEIIGQSYTVALDKNGNIVGMWPGSANTMIGVLTDVDYARIGLGKYAVEFEIFTTEEKTETVRMLNGVVNPDYFPTQTDADDAINDVGSDRDTALGHDHVMVGSLVKLESYTKDGATYWKLANIDSHQESATLVGKYDNDETVTTGVSDTLAAAADHTAYELNNDSVIFVAEYDFGYNQGTGNQGANYNVRYKVYKNFRNIPCIDASGATDNIIFQVLDNAAGDEKYCLIGAVNPDLKYTMKAKQKIVVDDSFLVLAPDATYADHSDYFVAKNGQVTTISVANVNNSVNDTLQQNIRTGNLLVATGTNTRGYITDVAKVEDVAELAPNMGDGETDTVIEQGTNAVVSKGVLKWNRSGTPGAYTYANFLTVADNCVVKIANVDSGKLYDATLASVEQYNDHDMAYELDADGYVSYLYIID